MLLKIKKGWEISEHLATDEALYLSRRDWLKTAGIAGIGIATGVGSLQSMMSSATAAPITGFPATRNTAYEIDRPVTNEQDATTYTNFYEFHSISSNHRVSIGLL